MEAGLMAAWRFSAPVIAMAAAFIRSSTPVAVIAGTLEGSEDAEPAIEEMRAQARRARLDLLAGVQGSRLIAVLGGADDPLAAAEKLDIPLALHGALRNLALGYIAPDRNQQLAGERNDRDPADPPAFIADAGVEPTAQGARWLMSLP